MSRPSFALSLPSDLRMLGVARTFVEAACQACGLDRCLIHALVLATGEAVSNIIKHSVTLTAISPRPSYKFNSNYASTGSR